MISIHQLVPEIHIWDYQSQYMFAIKNGRDSSVKLGRTVHGLNHVDDGWYRDYARLVWSST